MGEGNGWIQFEEAAAWVQGPLESRWLQSCRVQDKPITFVVTPYAVCTTENADHGLAPEVVLLPEQKLIILTMKCEPGYDILKWKGEGTQGAQPAVRWDVVPFERWP